MKCSECVENDLKSTVQSRGATQTLLGWMGPSWHEEGVRHSHDPNTITEGFECSNGHSWVVKRKPQCRAANCDYGQEHT